MPRRHTGENGRTVPLILHFFTGWKWVVRFVPTALAHVNDPAMNEYLWAPEPDWKLFVLGREASAPARKRTLNRPAHCLFTIMTTPYRLLPLIKTSLYLSIQYFKSICFHKFIPTIRHSFAATPTDLFVCLSRTVLVCFALCTIHSSNCSKYRCCSTRNLCYIL